MSLKIETLMDLAEYVSRESRRVRIGLEIPDVHGHFSTSIDHLIESLPQPRLSDAVKMEAYFDAQSRPADRNEMEKAIKELSARLARLPRLTRGVQVPR